MQYSTASLQRAAYSLPESVISHWPGTVGRRLRALYWGRRLGAMGARCSIDVGVIISCPERVFIGDDVWIDNYVTLSAGPPNREQRSTRTVPNEAYQGQAGDIHIGSRTHIAPYALVQGHGGVSIGDDVTVGAHLALYSYSHHYREGEGEPLPNPDDYHSVPKYSGLSPMNEQSMLLGPVTLANASAVLANSVVLPGAMVCRYAIVGAASLVQGRVPPGVIASGNPLQIRKHRFGRELGE